MNTHPHTATPTLSVIDPRTLVVRNVGYCRHPDSAGIDPRITRQGFNAAGRLIESWDPRLWGTSKPNLTTVYGLRGQPLLTDSVDGGWQLSLPDQAGSPCSFWDARGSQRHTEFDEQQRPITVTEQAAGELPRVVERLTYGDSGPAFAEHNQCGQLIRHDDPAGSQIYPEYGMAAAVLREERRFLAELETPDWPLEPEARDELLEPQSFITRHTFNPTGELRQQTDAMGNLRTFGYDLAGKPDEAWLQVAGEGESPKRLVSAIRYNALDQVESESAGNGVVTRVEYAADDGRLLRLQAALGSEKPLQDLNYVYDPVGNIVELQDRSQPVTHFNNQRIDPINRYRYDSLYQLVEARGWEVSTPSHGPALPTLLPTPLDPNQRRNYTQQFEYDRGGNLITRHHSGAPGFSMFTSARSNRSLGQRDDGSLPGEPEIAVGFDACGNQRELQRGQSMDWDIRNQLSRVTLVKREIGPDDYEGYRYDRPGHRLRKVGFAHSSGPTLRSEVRYLPGLEIHRQAEGEEHHVISLEAGRSNVRALHWPQGEHSDQLRYSLSDHLGSSTLELDDDVGVLTQEHYYPFGGTACWAGKSALVAKYKTLRYSGKERDATGLYCYGFRYYAPWLQRWVSPDPARDLDGLNIYVFVGNTVATYLDINGLVKEHSSQKLLEAEAAKVSADEATERFRLETHPGRKFKEIVNVIINRNIEFERLGGFVFVGDFSTPVDNTYFWSGNSTDFKGQIIKSAMDTAQFLAGRTGGATVEMTTDGDKLNEYSRTGVSAGEQPISTTNYLKQRLKFLDSPSLREHLLRKEALRSGVDIEGLLGQIFFSQGENPLNETSKDATDALWNVVSIRFARQAVGDVKVIHARTRNDPFFQSPAYLNNIWSTKEKVALTDEAKTTVIELFADDLQPWELQGPRRIGVP
ncbi:RHS repeat domain-containing protein [Pseudomonas laurylsulfatiphila]|uniref:RHS repeat domain-containing protein n=1 Tax=Pseudomonas laurylsulfatiphila TaxID=2011015 RepID=UPI00215FC035|nr:RHS repeat-associated core domain-containing protein [Pseudomonas laurylsulfatiphila]UVM05307.1 RHS repeat protein [Pseudomonas laurylsulfatiphila]